MKTFKAILSYVSGFSFVIMLLARIAFVAGASPILNTISLICMAITASAYIFRIMAALITDETSRRIAGAVVILALLFLFDYAMSQLLPGVWSPDKDRWSRVIGSYFVIFIGLGGMLKIVYNLYTPLEGKKRQVEQKENSIG